MRKAVGAVLGTIVGGVLGALAHIDIFVPSGNDTVRIAYRPARLAASGFELLVSRSRRHLLDRNGRWHLTTRMRVATEENPPPLDLRAAADGAL